MTVRQAGTPASDFDLTRAGEEGWGKYGKELFPPNLTTLERLKCRLYPRITFFFDGTGNNLYQELEKPEQEQALTNIAKLYLAAINDLAGRGATPIYISGVGTPFRIPDRARKYNGLLRDDNGGAAGLGLGLGGQMRIDYAIAEIEAILLEDWSPGATKHMPYVSLAVFGFSRGATEARAFVRQLIKRCGCDEKGLFLFGWNIGPVPLRITFMGLFDTVASVGGPALHLDWGAELAIPRQVERCLHYVAAHEVRRAFPLDSVRVDKTWPANCEEVIYPGVHSDVGGGYAPNVQGRSNLLSRIPLRHMYAEALRANVPLLPHKQLPEPLQRHFALPETDDIAALYPGYMSALPAANNDIEALIQAHRRLLFQWRGALDRQGRPERLLGKLQLQARLTPPMCAAVPAATDLDHPECNPAEWSDSISRNLEQQATRLLAEQRRLAQHIAFLRHPVEGNPANRDWPPPQPRKRTTYEDLMLSAWDSAAPVAPAVERLLTEHVHDSVAHFTSWPCALYDPRGVYCDQVRYHAARPWLGRRHAVVT